MKIGELARRTGLTTHTIRYYERIGLLPQALRARSSQRQYDGSILPWIAFLGRLKTTGMPIRDMLRYADLRAGGEATAPARKTLLAEHRQRVSAHVAALKACLSVLDTKIAGYADRIEVEKTSDADLQRRPLPKRVAGPVRHRRAWGPGGRRRAE